MLHIASNNNSLSTIFIQDHFRDQYHFRECNTIEGIIVCITKKIYLEQFFIATYHILERSQHIFGENLLHTCIQVHSRLITLISKNHHEMVRPYTLCIQAYWTILRDRLLFDRGCWHNQNHDHTFYRPNACAVLVKRYIIAWNSRNLLRDGY